MKTTAMELELQVDYSLSWLPHGIKPQWEKAGQNYWNQFSLLPNNNHLPGGNSNLGEQKPLVIVAESFPSKW